MRKFLFTCLALILATTVLAQAAFEEDAGIQPRIPTGKWTALYAGATQLDGMNVAAALERSEQEITVPAMMADRLQTLVPLAPVAKKSFRLTLVALDQASIRVSFPLVVRTSMTNGQPVVTYHSEPRPHDQFQFALFPQNDGGLLVHYRRNAGEAGEVKFLLRPLPQLF